MCQGSGYVPPHPLTPTYKTKWVFSYYKLYIVVLLFRSTVYKSLTILVYLFMGCLLKLCHFLM